MTLADLLVCPVCKGELERSTDYYRCAACPKDYPVVDGVPVLLPRPEELHVQHEGDLVLREDYDAWLHRYVLESLHEGHVIVDAGCGNMKKDLPNVIRMDVVLTPYVDLVADLHALPFRDRSLAFVFALAVVEHLRNPFQAADEILRSLQPGGYVYGECNFVFTYHGYPHHYFNASVTGLRQVFAGFEEIRTAVAPFQMPSFAVENLLSTYLHHFQPADRSERKFAAQLRDVLEYPLRDYDAKFPPEIAHRMAAGCYFYGYRAPEPDAGVIPPAALEMYRKSSELRDRFSSPFDLGAPGNFMEWVRGEGRESSPELDAWLAGIEPFRKRG